MSEAFDQMRQSARIALFGRRSSYLQVFTSPPGKAVLADIARFCRATESTFHEQHAIHCKLDGRREVFLRINQHLRLSDEELWELVTRETS